MAQTVILKRSAVPGKVPTTSDLGLGELAVNTHDGKLYLKRDNGTAAVIEIGAGAGGGSGDVSGPVSSAHHRLATFSGTTGKLIQEATHFDIPGIATPAAPLAMNLRMFASAQAGRMLPAMICPSGLDTTVQPALFRNTVYMWLPGIGATAAINFGTSWLARNNGTSAVQTHPNKASTNALTSMNRATFSTGTTATGTSGIQSAATVAWRGNAVGLGGFFFFSRFAVETYRADLQLFVGLSVRNAALAGEPSAENNSVGLCKDSTDTNWFILTRNGSTATKTPLQTPLAVSPGMILDFMMFCPPGAGSITFRLVNALDGTVYSDEQVVTNTLPTSISFMFAHASIRSTVGTTAALLALNRIYVETEL